MIIKYINESVFGNYKNKTNKDDILSNIKKQTAQIINDQFAKDMRVSFGKAFYRGFFTSVFADATGELGNNLAKNWFMRIPTQSSEEELYSCIPFKKFSLSSKNGEYYLDITIPLYLRAKALKFDGSEFETFVNPSLYYKSASHKTMVSNEVIKSRGYLRKMIAAGKDFMQLDKKLQRKLIKWFGTEELPKINYNINFSLVEDVYNTSYGYNGRVYDNPAMNLTGSINPPTLKDILGKAAKEESNLIRTSEIYIPSNLDPSDLVNSIFDVFDEDSQTIYSDKLVLDLKGYNNDGLKDFACLCNHIKTGYLILVNVSNKITDLTPLYGFLLKESGSKSNPNWYYNVEVRGDISDRSNIVTGITPNAKVLNDKLLTSLFGLTYTDILSDPSLWNSKKEFTHLEYGSDVCNYAVMLGFLFNADNPAKNFKFPIFMTKDGYAKSDEIKYQKKKELKNNK